MNSDLIIYTLWMAIDERVTDKTLASTNNNIKKDVIHLMARDSANIEQTL